MRVAVFEESDNLRIGEVVDGHLFPFDIEVNELGVAGLPIDYLENPSKTGEKFDVNDVVLLAPVLIPPRIFGIGLNYLDHAIETGRQPPKSQTWFMKQPTSINEPFGDVEKPYVSDMLDFEVELVVIIGKTCRHVPAQRAHEVILGYTIGCDYSVRDWQNATSQFTLGKGFDTLAPIGPFMITADELGEIDELGIRCFVNDELMQNGKVGDLIFKIPQLIEHATKAMTLLPGDIIFTGTPAGVGMARNPQIWLKNGDLVRCEIDKIGQIENRIVDEIVETIIE